MNHVGRILPLFASALAFAAASMCAGAAETSEPRVHSEMLVSTDWLNRNLDNPNVVILHVAEKPAGYRAGHVPGARFLAWDDVVTTRGGLPNEIPPLERLVPLLRRLGIADQSRVIVYDENAGLQAARVYVTFDYLGMGNRAALLDGQLKTWRAEGRPLTTAVPEVRPSTYTPTIHPDIIVPFRAVQELVRARDTARGTTVTMLDGRPEAQYSGAEAGEGIAHPGHIPGAESLCWEKNLVSKDNPVLRPVKDLRETYEKAGATAGHPVVTYCRTGVMASHDYFTAKYLGYDARLYDGSYMEWNRAKDAKIAK